jgi:hypothetical protein
MISPDLHFRDVLAFIPCLMNISTDMHATREVQDYLLSAVNEGEKKCRNFVNSALSVGQSVSFYSPISIAGACNTCPVVHCTTK